MAFLTLLVCSLLVASSYSQPGYGGASSGGGGGYGSANSGGGGGGGGYGGPSSGGGGGGGGYGGASSGGGGGYGGASSGGGGYGGANPGGNSGGDYNGGNSGGGSNNEKCSCSLNCVDVVTKGATASCQPGYIATSCSCGKSCGSHSYRSVNTCFCQCNDMDWTSARCCRNA